MSLFFFFVCTFSASDPESLDKTVRFRFSPTSESAEPERLRPLLDGDLEPDLERADLTGDGEREPDLDRADLVGDGERDPDLDRVDFAGDLECDPDLRDRDRDLRLDWDLACKVLDFPSSIFIQN